MKGEKFIVDRIDPLASIAFLVMVVVSVSGNLFAEVESLWMILSNLLLGGLFLFVKIITVVLFSAYTCLIIMMFFSKPVINPIFLRITSRIFFFKLNDQFIIIGFLILGIFVCINEMRVVLYFISILYCFIQIHIAKNHISQKIPDLFKIILEDHEMDPASKR